MNSRTKELSKTIQRQDYAVVREEILIRAPTID